MIDKLTSTKLTMVKLIMVKLIRRLTMAKLTMLAKTHFSIFQFNGRDVLQVPRINKYNFLICFNIGKIVWDMRKFEIFLFTPMLSHKSLVLV
jgi:hypothetical protein